MSESIKEVIIKFFCFFIIMSILGHFIKVANINLEKAFYMSLGMSTVDLIVYIIKKKRKEKLKSNIV